MQKITRIYVGNYGIDMAWYDGIIFDLTDPDTGEPTDTIINLENGGGKTTLLSFIFSCFETPMERFLKHIQNRNHRFAQYFARDGLPGMVLIEWEMPPRVAGGGPYRLVVGQVVTVKSDTDRDHVDRVFFSFLPTGDLRFESVPAPKLNFAPATTMAEVTRWIQEAQKHDSTFFHTRVQQDWHKHLREERLIDIEMLQLQVNFSAQEGGIDAGFLTFNSEPEFLRKFFDLTLDQERTASVRRNVVEICDRLRRKPFYQRQLAELTMLQASLTEFDTLARIYAEAKASQQDTLNQGGGMVLSLEARHREKTITAAAEAERKAAQEKIASENENDEKTHSDRLAVLISHRHTRQVKSAEAIKSRASTTLTEAKAKLRHIRAAQAKTEIDAFDTTRKELETQAAQAETQLHPWKQAAEKHGAILRRALYTEEQRLRKEAQAEEGKEAAAKKQKAALVTELATLASKESDLVKEQATLNADESAYEQARTDFILDGLLEAGEETAFTIERWSTNETNHRTAEAKLKGEAAELREKAKYQLKQAKAEAEAGATLSTQAFQHQTFIGQGQAEREALSQLPIMRQAAEAETADPDSPALLTTLDRLVQSGEREVSLSDVRLAELRASRTSIEETGVSGSSRDVNTVVTRLRELGVRSAQPYNTYIAKAIPNAEHARKLVASNPARFLGVCVASGEFETALGIAAQPPELSTPIVISTTALDAEPMADHVLVLSASDDARFNVEAAAALLSTLEKQIQAEETTRKIYANQQRDALAGKHRLEEFLKRYGASAMQAAAVEVARLTAEANAAKERGALAEEKATEYGNTAEQRQVDAQTSASYAADAKRNVSTLERFVKTHEAGHPARKERLQAMVGELQGIGDRRTEISLAQEHHETLAGEAFRTKVVLEQKITELESERVQLKYYDKSFPAAEYLAENPQELAILRQHYADAASTYDAQERDRLGLLHQRLEQVRGQYLEKTKAFAKSFSGILVLEMAPYLKSNFDELIPKADDEIEAAGKALMHAEKALAVVTSQSEDYHKKNKPAYAPTAEMEAMDDDTLDANIELAFSLKHSCSEAIKAAKAGAERAQELAKQAENEAKQALNAAKVLRSALSLPELPVASTVQLQDDIEMQARAVIDDYQSRSSSVNKARDKAFKAFDALKTAATSKNLNDVEPEIALQLQRNDFDAACADSSRLLEGIIDRIGTTQSSLDSMQADFDNCVGELSNLVNSALTLLNSAVTNKKVPVGAPYVGGKSIIKMKARFSDIPQDARRLALQNYLDALIDTSVVPARGPELVAEAVLRIYGKALGLQMLKMVPDENLQYVPVDKIQNSGGEGVVMAMFLYLLISQLRSETQAKLKKTGGGPLILDNPFAKATTPTLWKAQRLLAQSMDVQLIFATALPDYNTVGEFARFNRLRKAGKNTKTGRWHLESVDFKLQEPASAAA